MILDAIGEAEAVFDLVRFYHCHPTVAGTLPGKVGLLDRAGFSCALFYSLEDHESYLIGGEVVGHQIIAGIGLDMSNVAECPQLGNGEVGHIARHGLRMLSAALEANTETSKFTQLLTLIEYLADPDAYQTMTKAKKAIGRHVAQSRLQYEEIMEDFKRLTSEGKTGVPNRGLRHNIVHLGKRFEDLMEPPERAEVFRRLWRYAGVPLQHMIERSSEDWSAILA